jgi:hypothetical protein
MLDRPVLLTAFDYMYRDAGNFKAHGSILISGRLSGGEKSRILDAMEANEFFIAEQLAIPPLYDALFQYSDGRISSDHAWHSFCGFRELDPVQALPEPIWGQTHELVAAFEQIGEWDIFLSPNAIAPSLLHR